MSQFFLFSLGLLVVGGLGYLATKRARATMRAFNASEGQRQSRNKPGEFTDVLASGLARFIAVLVLGVGGVGFVLSWFVYVPANTLAVVIDTGTPVDVKKNGVSVTWPWRTTVEFEAYRQFIYFTGDKEKADADPNDEFFPCVTVRLSEETTVGATACINGAIEWQLLGDTTQSKEQTLQIYKDYKNFERMRGLFLQSRAATVFGDVFKAHNPLVPGKNQTIPELNTATVTALNANLNGSLKIHAVSLGQPDYDEKTDAAIASLQAEKAKTATAEQSVQTSIKAAESAAKLGVDPAVKYCIDAAVAAGREPGLCLGGQAAVLVGGSTPK